MRPCCRYNGPQTETTTALEYFNGPDMVALRDHFNNDPSELPERCNRCSAQEAKGVMSFRQATRDYFSGIDVTAPKLRYVQLNMGWACNMSCYMCDPKVSSGFAEEYKAIGLLSNIPKKNIKAFAEIVDDIPNGSEIDFVNGEFFIDATANRILDLSLERDWTLTFTTNASIITDEQLDKLNRIDRVNICVSMDGTGQLYDIMRYPSTWDNFKTTLDKLMSTGKVVNLRFVAQNLNMFGMVDAIEFSNQIGLPLEITSVEERKWLMMEALDLDDRQSLLEMITSSLDKTKLSDQHTNTVKGYIDYIKNCKFNEYENNMMIKRLSAIWKHRHQDFSLYKEIYPCTYDKICKSIETTV